MTGVTGVNATLDMQGTLASGLDVEELRMELEAAHKESKAANEAAQVSIIIATLSEHILSKLQISFVYWKKRTVLRIARKKRDKRRVKSMQARRQRLQVRFCNIWFRAHRILEDRVADVVDRVVHYNLKHKFLFLWREFREWMQELVGIYAQHRICP
jgi:ribonuclease HI